MFELLKQGLEEALEWQRGNIQLVTRNKEIMNKKWNEKQHSKKLKYEVKVVEDDFIEPRRGKKPKKKNDLTQDIKEFLAKPITLESIKDILLRLEGRWKFEKPGTSRIKVFSVANPFLINECEFFILIYKQKFPVLRFYLTEYRFVELNYFSFGVGNRGVDLCTSFLKMDLCRAIWAWLSKNIIETIVVE